MASLSQVRIPTAFRKSALEGGVAESDFLFLGSLGIVTHEAFAMRVHSSDALEGFLRDHVCPSAAYQDPDQGLLVFNRTPAVAWREFQLSEDCASLRKLWLLSKEMCKAEVEKMASGESSGKAKLRMGAHVAMEEAAIGKGMPNPTSDSERPALYTLNQLAKSFQGPGASFEYLAWETYLTMEEEDRLGRAGVMPKPRGELTIAKDSRVEVTEKDSDEPLVEHVVDLEMMRKRLEVRARAAAMLGIASYQAYRSLHDRYFGKVLAQVPEGMRGPTVSEVRRFDRTLHQELLRWLSRDMGTLENGLTFYLNDDGLNLWRLLDPVIKSLPDQGVEKAMKGRKRKAEEGESRNKGDSPTPLPRRAPAPTVKLKQCLVCKKRHTPLCQLPENFRKQKRAEMKEKKASAKAEAKAKAHARRDGES